MTVGEGRTNVSSSIERASSTANMPLRMTAISGNCSPAAPVASPNKPGFQGWTGSCTNGETLMARCVSPTTQWLKPQSFMPIPRSANISSKIPTPYWATKENTRTPRTAKSLGERVYLPQIRQFHAPDTSSPFGIGGPHAYGYCVGNDPINFHDPSGHFSVSRALRNIWGDNLPEPLSLGESGKVISTILFSGIGVLTAIMTAPASLIVAAALAALTSAVLAVTAVVIAESHPEWSQALAWASLFFGIASGATALIKNMPQRFARLSNYLGNTTRTVGKNVFRRTAAVSPAQK